MKMIINLQHETAEVREVSFDDIDALHELLQEDSEKYLISASFSKEDIANRFMPIEGLVHSYVILVYRL
jgi:hypothetical protein